MQEAAVKQFRQLNSTIFADLIKKSPLIDLQRQTKVYTNGTRLAHKAKLFKFSLVYERLGRPTMLLKKKY